jgi:hypothetical protein
VGEQHLELLPPVSPDGAAGLDVEDDRVLGIDQVVGGVGEEGMALVGLRRANDSLDHLLTLLTPLRRRIGGQDELGHHLAGRAEGLIVEGGQILAYGRGRHQPCRPAMHRPDRALLVASAAIRLAAAACRVLYDQIGAMPRVDANN